MLHRLVPAVNTGHVAHRTTCFFSRTQQFPGECGHGQDPEDHGCPAEPLHGVSVLSVADTSSIISSYITCIYLYSYKHILRHTHALSSLCLYVQIFHYYWNGKPVLGASPLLPPVQLESKLQYIQTQHTVAIAWNDGCCLSGQRGRQNVCDTWLAACCPARSCYPHTFRINLLQRWPALTIAGHLVKNVSGSTAGAAHSCPLD